MTITEFLLARIAEDEKVALRSRPDEHLRTRDQPLLAACLTDGYSTIQVTSGRVLAECEAKRRIVEHASTVSSMDQQIEREWGMGGSVPEDEDEGVKLLRMLAMPYADHPDYQQEWRPPAADESDESS